MRQKGTTWTDANGKEIPTYAINPVLKIEEKSVHKIARIALRAEKALQDLIEAATESHALVFDAKIKDADIKGHKHPSGGLTINSFDNTIEVKITKPDTMYFDNTYTKLVKQKFDEYFAGLNAGNETAAFLKDLVNEMMFTSGGKLDNSKVLKLRKYRDRIAGSKMRIKGKAFIEAVDLFDKAIKNKPGGTGIYVSVCDKPGDKKRRVALKYTDV
ncbi:MAG: hypothetical protein B6I20_05465 [Bacteroidetes bacterium 4572_117]|nr:MAG: hypothetical protein B6I20_05465 [Bacteroidetes bacterium 4572_117]